VEFEPEKKEEEEQEEVELRDPEEQEQQEQREELLGACNAKSQLSALVPPGEWVDGWAGGLTTMMVMSSALEMFARCG